MSLETILRLGLSWTVFFCFVYLMILYGFYLTLAMVAGLENTLRRRQARAEDFDTLSVSRFTVPVSIIAPAHNEEVIVLASVRSLLEQRYPEFEVVVVNDGSTDGTLERLKEAFHLEPRQVFYKKSFATAPVRAVYRSRTEPRLVVIDKENGGKADALNCGVNLARYRYVGCVDADTFYHRKALLYGMRLAVKDPGRVIGVTSLVAISDQPERRHLAGPGEKTLDRTPFIDFQFIDYLRAFLGNRLAWTRWKFMLCAAGVFSIWRRDVVQELGGFSTAFTCEDIEFTFRAHYRFINQKVPYEILSLPEIVASTEGPAKVRNLVSQRSRWQRVIMETLWHYRSMFLNPRYGSVGLLGMPYYVIYEGLAPLVELAGVLSVLLAFWLGVVGWKTFFLFLATVTLSNGVLTNVSILLQDWGSRSYRLSSLAELIVLGAIEFVIYRPVLFFARWKGAWGFLRGDREWHKFERNKRLGPAAWV
jgi:biofilm PGA synthesis N-glycosyltransferase PgaC